MDWYIAVLKKYAEFNGRARRKELWFFTLFNIIASVILVVIDSVTGIAVLYIVYSLGVLVPSIAVGARRLHDTGRSGWWLLIGLVPVIGSIVLIVFFVLDSDPGDNAYGPNPKA